MEVTRFEIDGPILIKPRVFRDNRGHFMESFNQLDFEKLGIATRFVQDNESKSCQHTLRGLHYQVNVPQAKLVRVAFGAVLDVAVDIRQESATFGKWMSAELSDTNFAQLYLPEGFAHGFQVLSEYAVLLYKVSSYYLPEFDRGILWSDPRLAIPWPHNPPVLSDKDQKLPLLSEIDVHEKRV